MSTQYQIMRILRFRATKHLFISNYAKYAVCNQNDNKVARRRFSEVLNEMSYKCERNFKSTKKTKEWLVQLVDTKLKPTSTRSQKGHSPRAQKQCDWRAID